MLLVLPNLFWFCPDHDTGQPKDGDEKFFFFFLPDVSPISFGTEQCFQLLITFFKDACVSMLKQKY